MKGSRYFVVTLALFCFLSSARTQPGIDPFAAYLKTVPAINKIISHEDSGEGNAAIITKKLVFNSRNGSNKIYSIIAYPQQKGNYPGLLFLHGGGSCADELLSQVQKYAANGFIAVALDLPGICNVEKAVHSEGPWKARMKTEKNARFNVKEGADKSVIADAIIAALEAFNMLYAHPNVIVKRIGVTGYSWGGYSTTMLAGLLGDKVRAAYAVFGCGYYDEGSRWKEYIKKMPETERNIWLQYIDAGRRANAIKANYFLDAASNDDFFWPGAVTATLKDVPKNKNHTWGPNFNHKQTPAGPLMQQLFFDYYLKNTGNAFGKVNISKIKSLKNGDKKISIKINTPGNIKADSVILYYSEQNEKWPERVWKPLLANKEKRNVYGVLVSSEIIRKNITCYAYLTDDQSVTVSSYMYTLN